jgi:hypothetical protein
MTSSPLSAARSQYLLDLLAQFPDPRRRRGRRHPLAGLLAVGIAAVIAGSRSFAAIGQWAADAGPDVLAGLGAMRGAAEESTFRRAFALLDPGRLDQALGAWLWTRALQVSGRLVIAVDGKAVRGAKDAAGKAPHLVAALAHGIGAVLGQVAVDAKPDEIPAVRDLLKAFAGLAGAVITIDALHTQADTAQAIIARHADYVAAGPRGRAVIAVPFDPDQVWGAKAEHPAGGTIDGRRVRGTISRESSGWAFTVGPMWIRDAGVAVGDEAVVELAPEGPQREDLAGDIAAALAANPATAAFFDTLAQFYRKAYLRWIDGTSRRPDLRAPASRR